MQFNRNIWQHRIKLNLILVPCPNCRHSKLALSLNTIKKGLSKTSRMKRNHPDWDNQWDQDGEQYRFSCLLVCQSCEESVALVGKMVMSLEPDNDEFDGHPVAKYEEYFEPLFFFPAIPIIETYKDVPPQLGLELAKSFQLFWADIESCANRIRSGLEILLNEQGVRKTIVNKKGRRRLSLHERIAEFRKKNKDLANLMEAIKWLGNAGSHPLGIKREDILDGYEMMSHVLAEIYTKPSARLHKMARLINQRKKPISRMKEKPIL